MKHHATTLILTAAALTLSGCRTSDRYDEPEVAVAPSIDEATMLRDWPVIRAEYAPGDVVAGSVGFLLEVDEDVEEPGNFFLQVPTFIANAIIFPVTVFLPPPTESFTYEGVVLPASYTANPPLPKRTTLPASPAPTTRPTTQPTTLPSQVEPAEVTDLVPTTYPIEDVPGGVVEQEPTAPAERSTPATPRRETAPVAPTTPPTPPTPASPTTQPVELEK